MQRVLKNVNVQKCIELMECGIKREQQLPTSFLGVMQEVYSEWIKNCTELKHSSQAQLLSGMSKEALEAALAALNAQ